jgi:hypothetical protein
VIVLDYPRLFNGTDCNAPTWFSPSEETRLNETANMLKNVISAAATRAGANFVFGDVIPPFVGHAVCDGGGGSSRSGSTASQSDGRKLPPEGHRSCRRLLPRGSRGDRLNSVRGGIRRGGVGI